MTHPRSVKYKWASPKANSSFMTTTPSPWHETVKTHRQYKWIILSALALFVITASIELAMGRLALGPDGKVYLANGQVLVYSADGKPAGRIDVPERPLQLLFGGADGHTLFILTHHALYAAHV